jgi:hypothetical protein
MDNFSACVALMPLAVYLLLLGSINLSARPLVVRGTRETLALGLALLGLVVVGPMQLFMPQDAAGRFGQFVWLLLVGFYGLCLTLAILVSRPRLVVYNMTLDELAGLLLETARRLDPDTISAGRSLSMPLASVHLQLVDFPPLRNVSLVATHDEQSIGNWRRLERALRQAIADVPSPGQTHGLWLALLGLTILVLLALRVANDPQTIAHGLDRMLHP